MNLHKIYEKSFSPFFSEKLLLNQLM